MSRDATQHVLAIDLGTSGPKVALVDRSGAIAAWHFEPIGLTLLPGGGAEQDPGEWWSAIVTGVRAVMDEAGSGIGDIAAVACTAQWSGTVAVDAAGEHIGNAIIWMDSRGAQLVADVIGGPVRLEGYDVRKAIRWIRLTGGAPAKSGKDPVGHILWLKRHRPGVVGQTALFLEPKDYLNLRLTGRAAAGYDSIALHWVTDNRDVDAVRYEPALLSALGFDPGTLPELSPPNAILAPLLPAVAAELGIPAGIPVVMGTPDLHSAAVGSGAVADGACHLYLGTSSWLICHVPYKKTDLFHNMASLPSALPGLWLLANEQETAGACLTHLAQNLGFGRDEFAADPSLRSVYQALDRIAERVPAGSNGVIFTPWLYGERTPVEDATVRSAFFNQSLATTKDDLVRSTFEGVALNSRWLLRYVEKFIKRRVDDIRIVGGGANSEVWCRIHADVLGRTVHVVENPVLVNVRGVGLLAWLSLGRISVADIVRAVPVAVSYDPDPANRRLFDARFEEFVRIYKANRTIHARLNRT